MHGCLGVEHRVENHVMYSKWALWRSRRARGEGVTRAVTRLLYISPWHLH
jgi:hypothetical protein